MPVNGKRFEAESYEFKVASTGVITFSGDGSPFYHHEAEGFTSYATSALDLAAGIYLNAQSGADTIVGEYWYALYIGPGAPAPGYEVGGSSYMETVTISAVFKNLKLYGKFTGSLWRLTCSHIEIWVNGSLSTTLTWPIDQEVSSGVGANYVPFIGLPLTLSAPVPYAAVVAGGVDSLDVSGGASGGWRYRATAISDWIAPPIALHVEDPPPGGNTDNQGVLSGTTTWDATVNARQLLEHSPSLFNIRQEGDITFLGNMARGVVRLGESYAAPWLRLRFPQAQGYSNWRNVHTAEDHPQTFGFYPDLGEFLGVVGADEHAIEEPLLGDVYCPCHVAKETFDVLGGFRESNEYLFPSFVGPGGGHMWHADPIARYVGTRGNPLWLFGYWPDPNSLWLVDGQPLEDYSTDPPTSGWHNYWGAAREQLLDHPDLPENERRKTRNSLILSPTELAQGNSTWLDKFANLAPADMPPCGLRPVGVSVFQADAVEIAAEFQFSEDRPGEWSSEEWDVAAGAGGLELSGFVGGAASVDLTLASVVTDPFFLPRLAKAVELFGGDNVDSVVVSLIGYDGSEQELTARPATDIYDFIRFAGTKYAGSWQIPNNNGQFFEDFGRDTRPNGISGNTMANSRRVQGYELPGVGVYRYLRLTITPTDPDEPLTVNWPKLYLRTDHPQVFWESGKCAALVWPDESEELKNGAMLRWGQWSWYVPGMGTQDPPLIFGLGMPNSIIDWLAYRRRVFEGREDTYPPHSNSLFSSIAHELTRRYDAYEEQSIGQVDRDGMSVILPQREGVGDQKIRVALINSYAELSPLACFPQLARDAEWQPTGEPTMEVYDMAEELRPLISSAEAPAQLVNTGGEPVGDWRLTPPLGFAVWESAPVLNNYEKDWKIRQGGRDFALVRPWHGFACALTSAPGVGAIHATETGVMNLAVLTDDEGLKLRRFDFRGLDDEQTISEEVVTSPQVAAAPSGHIAVGYVSGGSVKIRRSAGFGEPDTWSDEEEIAEGDMVALATDRHSGIQYAAVGGDDGWRLWRALNPEDEFENVSEITDETGAGALEVSPDTGNRLVFLMAGESPIRYVSTDSGATWTEA